MNREFKAQLTQGQMRPSLIGHLASVDVKQHESKGGRSWHYVAHALWPIPGEKRLVSLGGRGDLNFGFLRIPGPEFCYCLEMMMVMMILTMTMMTAQISTAREMQR